MSPWGPVSSTEFRVLSSGFCGQPVAEACSRGSTSLWGDPRAPMGRADWPIRWAELRCHHRHRRSSCHPRGSIRSASKPKMQYPRPACEHEGPLSDGLIDRKSLSLEKPPRFRTSLVLIWDRAGREWTKKGVASLQRPESGVVLKPPKSPGRRRCGTGGGHPGPSGRRPDAR